MADKIYYVDGEFVPAEGAHIPLTDLALVRGYGVFDYFRTYKSKPIQLERNIQRFRNSAGVIGMTLPWTDKQIKAIILEAIARNQFDEASVRIIATGGDSPDFITPQGDPRLLVYVEPLKPLPQTWYTDGVKVITVDEERYLPASKSLNYIPAIIAMRAAKAAGAVEALYRDADGMVREGTTTNIFIFDGERVLTPAEGILPGVTRGRVMEILGEKYTIEERDLSHDDLLNAQEMIITAANKQIVPVVQLDEHRYGDEPGPWARWVMSAFRDYVMAAAAERDQQPA